MYKNILRGPLLIFIISNLLYTCSQRQTKKQVRKYGIELIKDPLKEAFILNRFEETLSQEYGVKTLKKYINTVKSLKDGFDKRKKLSISIYKNIKLIHKKMNVSNILSLKDIGILCVVKIIMEYFIIYS